jgi:hypothetical protein
VGALLRLLLVASVVVTGCSPAPAPQEEPEAPSLLGQFDWPDGVQFTGTTVGGLSGITYDAGRDVYYVISDDRSEKNPARFYTVRITLSDSVLKGVEVVSTTELRRPDGTPFPPLMRTATPPVIPPDPEGIAFDARREQLYWSSEGERLVDDPAHPVLLDPWVRVTGLDGGYRGEFTLPADLRMSTGPNGPRRNMALEGLTLTPSGESVFAGMEGPTFDDGPLPTATEGARTRVTRFDAATGVATAQFAYPLEPITAPDGEANGLSDLVALDDQTFLTVERSHGARNVARIYRASLAGVDDVLDRASLRDAKPMTKELVVDLSTTPGVRSLDNVEGIPLGPKLSDGRQSVVLVTDDNFSPEQTTQFLAIAL